MSTSILLPVERIGHTSFDIDLFKIELISLQPPEIVERIKARCLEWYSKRRRSRIRATIAARGRWKRPTPSIREHYEELETYAQSIGVKAGICAWDSLKVAAWIHNSKKRSEHASIAANARWKRWREAIKHEEQRGDLVPLNNPSSNSLNTLSGIPSVGSPKPKMLIGLLRCLAARLEDGQAHQGRRKSTRAPQDVSSGDLNFSADPRRQHFQELISHAWSMANGGRSCPWMDNDYRALDAFLKSHPDVNDEVLLQWLSNWANSAPRYLGKRPNDFLGQADQFARGPLDQYGNPPGPPGGRDLRDAKLRARMREGVWEGSDD